ncbi:MAG: ABC transporter ATP-binding protein [Alphaproteobacteria bacterium]|nr:ABC transporter ATP-binding protein [Alphaproteobacteria bacterium]
MVEVAAADAVAAGQSSGAAVRIEGLTKQFGRSKAVDDVSLDIDPGSFFTLLGPSGSGKTTTLMMVAGFVHPTAGEIFVGGRPVAGLPPQERQLGMVFQNYAVFPHLTVFQNIAFPLEVRRTPGADIRRRVGEMLELVRLSGYEQRLPRQLSGGEQQRVALARALVFRPRVLLMDEPLAALDKNLRTHMQGELKQIQQRLHVTVVYVTHDQEEALTMSDRLAVMNQGRVVQVGTPGELYEAPASLFAARFLGESSFIAGTVVDAGDGSAARMRTGAGVELSGRAASPLRVGQAVLAGIRPEKFLVDGAPAAGMNHSPGRVTGAVYAGDTTRYTVDIGAGEAVTVKLQNQMRARTRAAGDAMALSWHPAETVLFPAEAAAHGG